MSILIFLYPVSPSLLPGAEADPERLRQIVHDIIRTTDVALLEKYRGFQDVSPEISTRSFRIEMTWSQPFSHLKFSYFLVSKSESRGNFEKKLARVAARKKWLRANHAIQLVNYLPRWAPSSDWMGNPFVFFSMDNKHNRHNQQKITLW